VLHVAPAALGNVGVEGVEAPGDVVIEPGAEDAVSEQLAAIFDVTCRRLSLNEETTEMSTAAFRRRGKQASLF